MQNLITSKTKLEMSILTKLNKSEQKLLTLNDAGNVPFGEMSNEQKQGLAKCLVKLCYFVGIKEPLSIENLKMLVFYLANQHPTFTQEELEQAFFMASSGEFGDLEHYQSFSPMYVSKVIKAYTTKRSEAVVKYRAKLDDVKSEAEREEKAKNYDVVNGCIEAICIQYDTYLRYDEVMSDEDKMPFEEARASIAIQMGQRIGLFNDYKGKETAFHFFKRIFDPLPKQNADEVKSIIAKWVRSRVAENTK
jgi:hypothetical protein